MVSKAEKNYYINILLGIFGVICMFTGIAIAVKIRVLMPFIKPLHEWTGYILTVLMIVHFCMHWDWMQSMTKRLLAEKKKAIAIVLLIAIPISFCAGLLLFAPDKKAIPPNKMSNTQTYR